MEDLCRHPVLTGLLRATFSENPIQGALTADLLMFIRLPHIGLPKLILLREPVLDNEIREPLLEVALSVSFISSSSLFQLDRITHSRPSLITRVASVYLPPILPNFRLTSQHVAPRMQHCLSCTRQRTDIPLHLALLYGRAEGSLLFPTRLNGKGL